MKTLNYLPILIAALAFAPALYAEVDINAANAEQIASELSNIGLAKAKAIVRYRQKHGPFQSADELGKIQGIGQATIEKNRHLISISGTSQQAPQEGKHQGMKAKKPDCKDKHPS